MWKKAIICAVISILYLFNYNLPLLLVIAPILFLILFIIEYKKYADFNFVLFELLIVALPFSYYAVLGDRYVSIFVLIKMFFIVNLLNLKKTSIKNIKIYLVVLVLFMVFQYLISQSTYSTLYIDSFIKTMAFLLPLLAIIYSVSFTKEQIGCLLKLYVISGFISGLMVLIQYVFLTKFGIMGLGLQYESEFRLGLAGLFFDYSIMSIYMGTIAVLLLVDALSSNLLFNKFWNIVLCVFFIIVSVITSARSGIVAVACTMLVFLLLNRKIKTAIIMSLIALPLTYLVIYLFSLNRQMDFLADNGRWVMYQNALDFIIQHPIRGSGGLGYHETTGNMRIHNFILDWFSEYGIIIAMLLLGLFAMLLSKARKISANLYFLLLSCLIGGLFHSSFLNAHYLVIPIFLIAAYRYKQ